VIDTVTNTVVTTVTVGACPDGVAVTPDGKQAYVANGCSSSVSVIDTATNMVVATVLGVGDEPQGSRLPRTGNTPIS
jgi:YVTN family beta-propeller protein